MLRVISRRKPPAALKKPKLDDLNIVVVSRLVGLRSDNRIRQGTMAFIAFEGLDGSGKSTLISGLADKLKSCGINFILTREPGGTELGEEIRRLLLRTKGDSPSTRCELLLYEAIRAQHVDMKIRPELQRGNWVLCDRYSASSLAFQAGGRGLDDSAVQWLNNYATGHCEPDLWVLLDLTTEEASRRMDSRNNTHRDRFEKEKLKFHERVRQKYLAISEGKEDWLCLDAQCSPKELKQKLLTKLNELGFLR